MTLLQTYPLAFVVVAFVVGGWFGFFAACILRVSHDADERIDCQRGGCIMTKEELQKFRVDSQPRGGL